MTLADQRHKPRVMRSRGHRQSHLRDVIGLGPAIVLIAIGIFTGGCGGNGRTEGGEAGTNGKGRSGTQGPQTTIVFLDPTTIQGTDGVRTMVADSMRSIAKRHLQTPGDKVLALPIRRRTEVKTPQVQLRNRIDPGGDAQFVDQQAMQDAVVEKKTRALVAEAESLLTRFVGEVATITRTAPKGPGSDLLGAVEVIREETRPDRARAAYFFSDMFHSVPAGQRDFEENPPSSRAEAREWARRDAERIRERAGGGQGEPDTSESRGGALLKETTIRMTPGSGATRPASPRVEVYWRALFAELGCDTSDITYN